MKGNLQSAINAFNQKVEGVSRSKFRGICTALKNETIRNTPVDTGRLRGGWQGEFSKSGKDETFLLSNNVEYATFVEHGTQKMRPARMLGRAIINVSSRL